MVVSTAGTGADPASHGLGGKVAVVIGGTGSLGGRMATALAGAGARTVVVGRDHANAGDATFRRRGAAEAIMFEACDATDRAELAALVGRVLGTHERIDVLVNAAGRNSATPLLEIDDAELESIVAVNQLAVMRACQEFGRYFTERARRSGVGASIINIGSMGGLVPLSRVVTYSMAKAAVHNLTKSLAREWGPLGIRCNVLVPGFFPAQQNRSILSPERVATIVGHTPLGRMGTPDDLVGATLLLAGDAGRFITGAELVVDGGFSATTI